VPHPATRWAVPTYRGDVANTSNNPDVWAWTRIMRTIKLNDRCTVTTYASERARRRMCPICAGAVRPAPLSIRPNIGTQPAGPLHALDLDRRAVPGSYNDAATVYSEAVSLFRSFKTGSKRLGS
jgi:hypothetical protein